MCPSYISLVPRPSVNVERGSEDETTPISAADSQNKRKVGILAEILAGKYLEE